MKLINTTAHLIWGPSQKKDQDKTAIKTGVKWLPGENPIDGKFWEQIKNMPAIQRLLAVGHIRTEKGEAKPLAIPKNVPQTPKGNRVLVGAATPTGPQTYQGDSPPDVVVTPKLDVPEELPDTLEGVSAAVALVLITKAEDREILARWYENETRQPVKDAIETRAEVLGE